MLNTDTLSHGVRHKKSRTSFGGAAFLLYRLGYLDGIQGKTAAIVQLSRGFSTQDRSLLQMQTMEGIVLL